VSFDALVVAAKSRALEKKLVQVIKDEEEVMMENWTVPHLLLLLHYYYYYYYYYYFCVNSPVRTSWVIGQCCSPTPWPSDRHQPKLQDRMSPVCRTVHLFTPPSKLYCLVTEANVRVNNLSKVALDSAVAGIELAISIAQPLCHQARLLLLITIQVVIVVTVNDTFASVCKQVLCTFAIIFFM